MKKVLLSLCLMIVLSISAEAQVRPPHPRYRHHPPKKTVVQPPRRPNPDRTCSPIGEFRFHVFGELGPNDFGAIFMHEIPYHFSVGGMAEYQVGHITSFGIGAEYYSSYGEHCHLFNNMQETYIHTLPIYANLKLALPNTPISPFVEGRIGYSVPLGEVTCNDPEGVHHYKSMGLYTGGAVGIKIYRTQLSFGMSAIDVVDSDLGFNGGRKDVITDYYVRLSFAF
ncbi:MAG: hypothetical protein K6G25_04005 [Bacteroidales bacterium]|nr:hypothetical protein [Bacteroidales bacterium]